MNNPQIIRFHKRPEHKLAKVESKFQRVLHHLMIFDREPSYECEVEVPEGFRVVLDRKNLVVENCMLSNVQTVELLLTQANEPWRYRLRCGGIVSLSPRGCR